MKHKLSALIKKVVLSSVAAIGAQESNGMGFISESRSLSSLDDYDQINKREELRPKLILAETLSTIWKSAAHRSHRSHSSHRSHYSGSSGTSSSSSSSSRSSSSTNRNRTTNNGLGITGSSTNRVSTGKTDSVLGNSFLNSSGEVARTTSGLRPITLRLGDRNLKLGMSGSDVTELINILLKKGYFESTDGTMSVYGSYTYDEMIEAVVKKYQVNNGLTADGQCGPATIYHLKNK